MMLKNHSKFLIVLLALALHACGGGGDNTKSAPTEDASPPRIAKVRVLPLGPGMTVVSADQLNNVDITIEFTKPIRVSTLADAVQLTNTSVLNPDNLLNAADYPAIASASSVTVKPRNLALGQTYRLTIDTNLTDVAGHRLQKKYDLSPIFSTEPLYSLAVNVVGLLPNNSLTVDTGMKDAQQHAITATVVNNGMKDVATGLQRNAVFNLTVSDASGVFPQVCVPDYTSGVVLENTVIRVACSDVVPLYPLKGADWNDYVLASNTSQECTVGDPSLHGYASCIHGGERRQWRVPGAASCDDIKSIKDDVAAPTNWQQAWNGAFEWQCMQSANDVIVYSTRLRREARLADLIHFSTQSERYYGWKKMSVVVSYKDGRPDAHSSPAPWWRNPVMSVSYISSAYPGVVFAADEITSDGRSNGHPSNLSMGTKASLTVKRGVAYWLNISSRIGLDTNGGLNFHWVEGNFNMAHSTYAETTYPWFIKSTGQYDVIRQVVLEQKFPGTKEHGISLSPNGNYTNTNHLLQDVRVSGAALNGMRVVGDYNVLDNIQLGYNGTDTTSLIDNHDAGLYIEGTGNRVNGIASAGNGGDGLVILCKGNLTDDRNVVNFGSFSSNLKSGVHLAAEATCPGIVLSGLTAANNNSDGITVNGLGGNSLKLHHITAAANKNLGVAFNAIDPPNITHSLAILNTNSTVSAGLTLGDTRQIAGLVQTGGVDIRGYFGDFFPTNPTQGGEKLWWKHLGNYALGWGTYEQAVYPRSPAYLPVIQDASACTSYCGLWDWSLVSTADTLLNANSTQYDPTSAIELLNDGIGNDDGICDLNESCLYTPNIGAYQGHGATQSGPSATGYSLIQYSNNGVVR